MNVKRNNYCGGFPSVYIPYRYRSSYFVDGGGGCGGAGGGGGRRWLTSYLNFTCVG